MHNISLYMVILWVLQLLRPFKTFWSRLGLLILRRWRGGFLGHGKHLALSVIYPHYIPTTTLIASPCYIMYPYYITIISYPYCGWKKSCITLDG
jgi:hypothetical protein